ncbi:MAG: Lipoprotein-releasing system transmembrane protein LolC [Opitutia bacterium UBA7350]|nr:MAG: Lipoprotein-releasing system transmembrane protein LolC [Opitutae bacterium UBA7350]
MPWYFYHALKQLFPSGRCISFFSLLSILGVTLGVCVLIIVQSVMNGFGENIRSRIVQTHGDIRIKSGGMVDDWESLQLSLEAHKMVMGAAPFAEGVIMLQYQNRPLFPAVRGIDPIEEAKVIPMQKFLTLGSFDDFDDRGVFLGEGLAYSLQVLPGATVEVFTPLMLQALKEDEVLLPREFKVLGFFRTGSPAVDGNTMITTLRVMQELYGMGDHVHGMAIRLRPGADAPLVSKELEAQVLTPDLDAVSWQEANEDFLFVIEQEKLVISFIIIFIILVACFSIAVALMMAVLRKTREIGLLVAMGAPPRQVAASFCLQGMVIGVVGTMLGIALAFLALHYRVQIMGCYASVTGSQINFLGIYDVYQLPVHYLASDFIVVTVFALVVSTLAGLVPAIRAARLRPAEALRSE